MKRLLQLQRKKWKSLVERFSICVIDGFSMRRLSHVYSIVAGGRWEMTPQTLGS